MGVLSLRHVMPDRNREKYRLMMEDWLAGKTDDTIRAYRTDWQAFESFTGSVNLAEQLLGGDRHEAYALVLRFRNAMKQAGLSPATINRRLSTIRSFITLAKNFGVIDWDLSIKNERMVRQRETRGPAVGTITKMLNHCPDDLIGQRDRLIIRMLFTLGLRVHELTSIKLEDIHEQAGIILISGKGTGVEQVGVDVPDDLIQELLGWIRASSHLRGENPFVFVNATGTGGSGRLTDRGVYGIIKRHSEGVGAKNVHPHSLRHAGITAAAKTHPVQAVMQYSRHQNLSSVQHYIDNFNNRQGIISGELNKTLGGEYGGDT